MKLLSFLSTNSTYRVDVGSGDEEEELLETAVILTEEDVEALKEFFLTPTDVIDFLKHL